MQAVQRRKDSLHFIFFGLIGNGLEVSTERTILGGDIDFRVVKALVEESGPGVEVRAFRERFGEFFVQGGENLVEVSSTLRNGGIQISEFSDRRPTFSCKRRRRQQPHPIRHERPGDNGVGFGPGIKIVHPLNNGVVAAGHATRRGRRPPITERHSAVLDFELAESGGNAAFPEVHFDTQFLRFGNCRVESPSQTVALPTEVGLHPLRFQSVDAQPLDDFEAGAELPGELSDLGKKDTG